MVSERQKVITLGGDPARPADSESKGMISNFKKLCIQDNVHFYLEHYAHLSRQTSGRDRRFIAREGGSGVKCGDERGRGIKPLYD